MTTWRTVTRVLQTIATGDDAPEQLDLDLWSAA